CERLAQDCDQCLQRKEWKHNLALEEDCIMASETHRTCFCSAFITLSPKEGRFHIPELPTSSQDQRRESALFTASYSPREPPPGSLLALQES
ncbi:hypothetical protein KUCAC02_004588, partial [Chaenocephalus aceratus]